MIVCQRALPKFFFWVWLASYCSMQTIRGPLCSASGGRYRCHQALKFSAFKTESLFLPSGVQMQLLHSRKCSSWGFSARRQYSCSLVFNKAVNVKHTTCQRLYQLQHPSPILCFIIPIFASSCWSKHCQRQVSQTSFSGAARVWPLGFQARVVVYKQVPSWGAARSAAIAWVPWAVLPSTLCLLLWGTRSPGGNVGEVRPCRYWIQLHYFHTSCHLVSLRETPGLPYLLVDQTVA